MVKRTGRCFRLKLIGESLDNDDDDEANGEKFPVQYRARGPFAYLHVLRSYYINFASAKIRYIPLYGLHKLNEVVMSGRLSTWFT